jgi:hypothetical protein
MKRVALGGVFVISRVELISLVILFLMSLLLVVVLTYLIPCPPLLLSQIVPPAGVS